MKYIKTFENVKKPRLRFGDYVTANDKYIDRLKSISCFNSIKMYSEVGIIVNVILFRDNNRYRVSYLSGHVQSFTKDELRLATPEEIEDYKIKENEIKYNL